MSSPQVRAPFDHQPPRAARLPRGSHPASALSRRTTAREPCPRDWPGLSGLVVFGWLYGCWADEALEVAMDDSVPSRFERLWTIDEAAEYLLMSKQTLYGWRCRGYGPPSYRLGNQLRYLPTRCALGRPAGPCHRRLIHGQVTVAAGRLGSRSEPPWTCVARAGRGGPGDHHVPGLRRANPAGRVEREVQDAAPTEPADEVKSMAKAWHRPKSRRGRKPHMASDLGVWYAIRDSNPEPAD